MFVNSLNKSLSTQQKRRQREFQAAKDLESGKQRRITNGMANSGSGLFPFFGVSGQTPSIQAPAQYNFSNIGRGSSITIGSSSSVNSNNTSSMSNCNNTSKLYGAGMNENELGLNHKRRKNDTPINHPRVKEVISLLDEDPELYEAFKYTAERRAEDNGMRVQKVQEIEARHSTYSFEEKKQVLNCVDKIQNSKQCSRTAAIELYRSTVLAASNAAPSKSSISEWDEKDFNSKYFKLLSFAIITTNL